MAGQLANKNTHIYSENVVLVVPNSEIGTTEEEKMKLAVGKKELLTIVPLSLSTIYRLEKNGGFPKRWYITDGRCAWNAEEVERWLDERQAANQTVNIEQEDAWHSITLSSTPSKRK